MATSLASQLQQLAAPQTSILDQKRKRRSILFDPSEAENYGRDVYFEIGKSGFEELVSVDREFRQFKKALFGKAAKEMQRVVENAATNKKLNKALDHFLLLLSPYLEKQAALKALEWLVYRFLVSEMNQCALLMCIFPYYESPLFVRVLQILDLAGEEWAWLRGSQKSGRVVAKATVFNRWVNYHSFRVFLAEHLRMMIKTHTKAANLKIAVAFYVSTITGGLCLRKEVTEEQLSSIVPQLPCCLASTPDLVAGAYLILTLLAVRTTLAQDLLHKILHLLTVEREPPSTLAQQHVLLLLALAHHQRLPALPPHVSQALNKMAHVFPTLEALARTKSVGPLLSAHLAGSIEWLGSVDCPLTTKIKSARFSRLVKGIAAFPMSSADSADVIWSVIECVKTHHKALANLDLAGVLASLEKGHPEGHSRAVSRLKQAEGDPSQGHKYKKILQLLVGEKGVGGGASSFLHLVHPNSDIRLPAVQTFLARVNKGQERKKSSTRLHLTNLLADTCPAIVLETLACHPGLRLLDPAVLVVRCRAILRNSEKEGGSERGKWAKVRLACLHVLTRGDLAKEDHGEGYRSSVLDLCLPLVLFPRTPLDLLSAKVVLESDLCPKEPFLAALSGELSSLLASKVSKPRKFRSKVWKVLPTVLSSLTPDQHREFWARTATRLGSASSAQQSSTSKNSSPVGSEEDLSDDSESCSLSSHFVSLVLLSCALGDDTLADKLKLSLGHRLLDTCLAAFQNFKVTASSGTEKMVNLTTDDLESCLPQVESGSSLPLSLLAWALLRSLRAFSLPLPCRHNPYWTLDMEEGGGGCEGEVLLLVKTMKGAMQLEQYGDTGMALRDELMVAILKGCLESSEQRFHFLSLLWGWDASLPHSDIIDDVLQMWSLKLGLVMLSCKQSSSLAWALGTSQPLVPALLSALTHPSQHIRRQALGCVASLAAIIGGRLTQSNHSVLLEAILYHGEELVDDPSQLASLLSELQTRAKVKCAEVTNSITDITLLPGLPPHLRTTLLYTLTNVNHTALLLRLLPIGDQILESARSLKESCHMDPSSSLSLYYILLGFTPATSDILAREEGWAFFFKAMTSSKTVLVVQEDLVSPQGLLIDQVMSCKFFTSLASEEVKSRLWSVLIARVVESGDPKEAEQLRKGLRKVSLDAAVIARQIKELKLSDNKVTTIRAAQAKRMKQKEESQESQLLSWRQLGLMLETIGVMASLSRPWVLVGPLGHCLQRSLTLDSAITDLTQQQILSALLHLLQKSAEQLGEDELKAEVQINTEVVVQCVRASTSPDTHRRAMLILAFAAKVQPDAVIQKVMPIFTFMGTSLMWRDDAYSFQVIHQTIQSIVPTLVKCESKEPLEVRLARVCQVFVDALPDVPQHRRLPLFVQLVSTIDGKQHLWVILALLANSHVMRGNVKDDDDENRGEERRGVPQDVQFALTLTSQFPVVSQTSACVRLLDYVSRLPEETGDLSSQHHQSPRQLGSRRPSDVISWDQHSPRQTCHFKYTAMGLISLILASEEFVGQVMEANKGEEEGLRDHYHQLLEKTIAYLDTVNQLYTKNKDKPGGRLLLSLQRKVIDVLDGVNAMLPPNLLLNVLGKVRGGILTSPLPLVRCRAVEILCAKLQPGATFFSNEHHNTLTTLTTILIKLTLKVEEPVENRQTLLLSLQLMTRLLGPYSHLGTIQPIMAAAVDVLCCQDIDTRLTMQALLVVAEAVGVLRALTVNYLSRLMPPLLRLLSASSQPSKPPAQPSSTSSSASDQLLLQATVTTTHKLVETIPQLLSPHLEPLLCALCGFWTSKGDQGRMASRILATREALATTVEPRILIPVLNKVHTKLAESDVLLVCGLMVMVEKLVGVVGSAILTTYHHHLLSLFTSALDLRRQKGHTETIVEVEMSVFSALSRLLLRLNQRQNSAFFLTLQSWATKGDHPTRIITFYRFSDHLAGIFKVLFIKAQLAEKVLDSAPAVLQRNNSLHHKDTVFGAGEAAEDQTCLLLSAVLDTLSKIFLYDSVGAISPDRFTQLVTPLTDQLENLTGGETGYEERLTIHLIPCLTKLTVAVGDDSLWKILNRQVLVRVRNDDQPQVVLAALRTFRALVEALGSDYLEPLLSDVLPYVTEALESSSTSVEDATREVFTCMETVLGQSLRDYLEY